MTGVSSHFAASRPAKSLAAGPREQRPVSRTARGARDDPRLNGPYQEPRSYPKVVSIARAHSGVGSCPAGLWKFHQFKGASVRRVS